MIIVVMVIVMVMVMVMRSTLTGYCQCSKVCGSPLTYAGDGNQVVADPDHHDYVRENRSLEKLLT